MRKEVHVFGGGTVSYVRNHLALAAPAYGTTARKIFDRLRDAKRFPHEMYTRLHLSRMAGGDAFETYEDLKSLALKVKSDPTTKIVFFNPAVVDFCGTALRDRDYVLGEGYMGKHEPRLDSRASNLSIRLTPLEKLIRIFRNLPLIGMRKDIFLVATKMTCGASEQEQYLAGLKLLKQASANLVLANDVKTRVNMIIVPEEAKYSLTYDREQVLDELVGMTLDRSHLTFTQSTVVDGEPIPWESELIPQSLRTVVDYCIKRGAYKKFLGVTAGHFAVKLSDDTFLTSRRKTDFNDMAKVGMVKIKTDGPDSVLAYGSKPSVGGQSQRIVFRDHPGMDCIVHFHCPIKSDSRVPRRSQREFECGSHECGKNTSDGLADFGWLKAVYLEEHGPNIVFNRDADPQRIIAFIEENFDMTGKTGGYVTEHADE